MVVIEIQESQDRNQKPEIERRITMTHVNTFSNNLIGSSREQIILRARLW